MKYILLVTLLIGTLSMNGQTFRLKGGVNSSDVYFENEDGTISDFFDTSRPGFLIGGAYEKALSELFFVETSLLFSLKAFKVDELQDGRTLLNKTDLYYLDLPILAKRKFQTKNKWLWFLAIGPAINLGLAGNETTAYDNSGSGQVTKEKVEWGSEEGQLSRIDFSLVFGGGVEFGRWQIGLNYDLGMVNISNTPDNTLKNRLWEIYVGYTINSN